MRKVKARDAVFDGASMRKADLTGSSFGDQDEQAVSALGKGVSFRNTDMEGARLDDTKFRKNADMKGASLRNTTCDGIYFYPDSSEGLDLRGAQWENGSVSLNSAANLNGGSFRGMTPFYASGSGASIHGSDLSDDVYDNCDLRGSFITGSTVARHCDLRNASFSFLEPGADLRGSRCEGATVDSDVKGMTGIRTDLDPEGVKPFDPESLGMKVED